MGYMLMIQVSRIKTVMLWLQSGVEKPYILVGGKPLSLTVIHNKRRCIPVAGIRNPLLVPELSEMSYYCFCRREEPY